MRLLYHTGGDGIIFAMADGTYERRGPREAELKRLQRLIVSARPVDAAPSPRQPNTRPSSFETEDHG